MKPSVPFISKEDIERDAEAMLAEYELARGVTAELPIAVEDIIEKHLKLRFEFDDMHARHDVPRLETGETDILGAIYGDGSIFIDESLDPEENPSNEGRYRLTLAHEVGHWRLHRHLIQPEVGEVRHGSTEGKPGFICRSSQENARVEWQANYHASCSLMPRQLVFAAWRQVTKRDGPFIFSCCKNHPYWRNPSPSLAHISIAAREVLPEMRQMPRKAEHDFAFNLIARQFAPIFNVSTQAMRIRLEQLGLLLKECPEQPAFAISA